MSYRVSVVTGTRADYGLLRELLFRLKANPYVELELIVTGSHLSESFGNTQKEIIQDGFTDFYRIPIPMNDDSKGGMANATGTAVCQFTKHFSDHIPELLIVLGDRYEVLAAVIAARMCGIAVAHISGGDITEGAIDNEIRHAITKMSQLHFPGCEQSRRRIIQMGEQPDTVCNVGEPGVENCLKLPVMGRKQLAESIGFDGILNDYSVVTFHPVTMENNTGSQQVEELIHAMDQFPDMHYIITMSNADAGGREINNLWLNEQQTHSNWFVTPSLGVMKYLSAMKYAKIVIGNSSSGIVEAPVMKVPTVNIGDRQKGRMLSESILFCDPKWQQIAEAIHQALEEEFQEKAKHVKSPFGDGNTSVLIEEHMMNYLKKKDKSMEKSFYDIPFELK